jgi:hypothetical protein
LPSNISKNIYHVYCGFCRKLHVPLLQWNTQEMHWHSFQMTILVHIYYRWNPNCITSQNMVRQNFLLNTIITYKMTWNMTHFLFNTILSFIGPTLLPMRSTQMDT